MDLSARQTTLSTHEEQLRDTTAKLDSVLETASDIILTVNRQGDIIFVNRVLPPLTPAAVIGTSCFRFVPEESRSRVAQAIEDVFSRRIIDSYEVQGPPGVDGKRQWWHTRVGPLILNDQVVAVTMCATDISVRKASELAITELAKLASDRWGQDFFQSVVKSLAVAFHGDHVFLGQISQRDSERVETLSAWSDGAFVPNFEYGLKNTPCANVVGKKLCFYSNDILKQFPDDPLLVEMGIRAYLGCPLFDAAGKPLGIIAVMWRTPREQSFVSESLLQVFTARVSAEYERHHAKIELFLAHQRLSLATTSGQIGIWDWDVVSDKMIWDKRMYELYGIRPEDFSGAVDMWEKRVHPEDLPRARREVQDALGGTREFHTEFRVVWPNGQIRHIEGHGIVLRGTSGTPVRMLGTNWDITARKQADEQVSQMQKMESVGRLAGGVAHDFNNLLAAILGFSTMAQAGLDENSAACQNLARVIEAANRGASLTQQLLTFARKKIVKPEVVDVNRVVRAMEPMLRRLVGENLEWSFAPAAIPGWTKIDIGSLEQVVMNLVVNARDAMPRGGCLTITTDSRELTAPVGPFVRISVSDTGVGIPENIRSKIFEPFFTTKPVGRGTGLGLATCMGIIRQAGGHIDVESEVGKGTTFKVYLPQAREPLNTAAVNPPSRHENRGMETVLLVEDEKLVRDAAQLSLAALGYTVIAASSGRDALERIEGNKSPIHILVTDVVMPEIGGVELALKLTDLRPEMMVLFSSGYTEHAVVQDGIMKENINFIQKPYSPAALAEKIRQVLASKLLK